MYMSRIRGPYVRFCERDEAVTPHPTRYAFVYWKLNKLRVDNNTFRAGYFNMNRLHGSALK